MGLVKTTAILAILAAVSMPKLLPLVMELIKPPLDERIGKIATLSPKELSPYYKGKSALLVGGTRGVGYGAALAMVRAGASHVTIVGRSETTGTKAVAELQKAAVDSSQQQNIQFVQGDLGTVQSSLELVRKLEEGNTKFDYLVVSAAIFPDWSAPLQNDDGIDKSFAIAVIGRYIVYRNMHKLLQPNARVLNMLAAGTSFPFFPLDRGLVQGKRSARFLLDAMHHFSLGNDLMLIGMDQHDANIQPFTRVSTNPGMIKTDLHLKQGIWFHIAELLAVSLMGMTVEESGLQQASILCSDKLPAASLSYVDEFAKGRVRHSILQKQVDLHLDWFWEFLTKFVPAPEEISEGSSN